MLQLEYIANDIKNTIGNINAEKIKLKYGAPTEILPKSSELVINGYSVPNRIENVVMVKNKLFNRSINSFEVIEYWLFEINNFDFKKYNANDNPITNDKNNNIYKPLSGSFAKA